MMTVKIIYRITALKSEAKSQMGEQLGNRAMNQKVAGSIPGMMLCPWARHFTLLASGECPCTYCKSLWIRASAK